MKIRILTILLVIQYLMMPAVNSVGGVVAPVTGTPVVSQTPSTNQVQPLAESDECHPGTGWVWTTGPSQPETADQVQLALIAEGIESTVKAVGFGEKDSCGNFQMSATDFVLTITNPSTLSTVEQKELGDKILAVLSRFARPKLGNVQIDFGSGNWKFYPGSPDSMDLSTISVPPSGITSVQNKKVYLLVYDPILSDGRNLSAYMGWNSYDILAQNIISFFQNASNGQVQYTVAYKTVVTDEWLVKIDGFRYTEETYLQVVRGEVLPHEPDWVNYDVIIDDPNYDFCGRLNRGEIDELWVYGGPWFGFYESRLVGPGAYPFNSPPIEGTHGCNKLLPIMGLNYERGLPEAIEAFGHRTIDTMTKVYGSREDNRTAHNWDRFTLVKFKSPDYSYSGCGQIHYPPNGVEDYDWSNSGTVLTNCEDFKNYPNLSDPLAVTQPVTCTTWNCNSLDYFMYWYGHFPSSLGCTDGVANNWWQYYADPNIALHPSLPCPPPELDYSTYLGGSGEDVVYGVAVDDNGFVYAAGFTDSADFPIANAHQPGKHPGRDAFILKLNPNNNALVYSTFLGGNDLDEAHSIVVDDDGNATVLGYTDSTDFPLSANPLQGDTGGRDLFLARFDSNGVLLYSTYLGGSDTDEGSNLVLDDSGNVYITGRTFSNDFPVTEGNSWQEDNAGGFDAFVVKVYLGNYQLVYGTYLGGSASDWGNAIALDGNGNVVITGITGSTDFPMVGSPWQASKAAGDDAFIAQLDIVNNNLIYTTYLGGNSADRGTGISVGNDGIATILGHTTSTDFPIQGTNPLQDTHGGGNYDAFVARLETGNSILITSTYLGGSGGDEGYALTLNGADNAIVTGHTSSTDFPTVGPIQGQNAGSWDVFISSLSADGSALLYSSYLGGSGAEEGFSVAKNSMGKTVIAGYTNSNDFPTSGNAYQTQNSGNRDAFITILGYAMPAVSNTWSALGTIPMDSDVLEITSSGTDLYAAGVFLDAGGDVNADYIAKWDGISWSALGTTPLNEGVGAIAVSSPDVYVGGWFTDAGGDVNADKIAKWDGTSWSALGSTPFKDLEYVNSLVISNTDLYVGGNFQDAGGNINADFIAKWDGVNWSALGTIPLNGPVWDMVISGTDLYVIGPFHDAGGDVNADKIAKWDGTKWSALGSINLYLPLTVAINGTDVYVGGDFTDIGGDLNADYIVRWNGANWSAVGSTPLNNIITDIAFSATDMYVSGYFTDAGGDLNADYIAKWDGINWSALGSIPLNSEVEVVAISGADIYAGGSFFDAGGNEHADYIARYGPPDIIIPNTVSIVCADANPTMAPSVDYIVTFSETIAGVNTTAPFNDFALSSTGITGALITGVRGSGRTYTVTVNTGIGNGTIRLDIVDDNSIVDAAGNLLGGVDAGDGNFTNGEEYLVVKSAVKPNLPVLLSPVKGKLLDTLQPTLDWKDSTPYLDHYQLQVSKNNTFTALVLDETNLTTSDFTFTTDLNPGKRYYWRVRSFNILYQTKGWSTPWNFRTPLDKPTLGTPACGTSLLTDRPELDWGDVNGATSYSLQVAPTTSFGTLLLNTAIPASEYAMSRDLPQNKTLYWRVRAQTPVVSSLWSEKCSFTTGNPPSVPLLISPANNALVKDYTPTLKWYKSSLPSGTLFKRYELQLDDNNDFSSPEIEFSTTDGLMAETSYTPPADLNPNTRYNWRVRAVNLVGAEEHISGWSAVRFFRSVMLPPVLLLPANGSTEVTLKPPFDWDEVVGATSYTIQISTSASFGTFLVNTKVTVSNFTPSTNLPKNKVIYWRVRANGPNGPSAWSKFQFTTPQ